MLQKCYEHHSPAGAFVFNAPQYLLKTGPPLYFQGSQAGKLDKLERHKLGQAGPSKLGASWNTTNCGATSWNKLGQAGPVLSPRERARKIFRVTLFTSWVRQLGATENWLSTSCAIRPIIEKLDKLGKPTYCNRYFLAPRSGREKFLKKIFSANT